MLERIKAYLGGRTLPPGSSEEPISDPELRIAACALLLELAHADEAFTAEEREHLERTVGCQYGLDRRETEDLLLVSDWRRRLADDDVTQFSRLVAEHYSVEQKVALVEVMWGLVRADGRSEFLEVRLVNQVAGLLGLEPGFLEEARKRWVESGGAESTD